MSTNLVLGYFGCDSCLRLLVLRMCFAFNSLLTARQAFQVIKTHGLQLFTSASAEDFIESIQLPINKRSLTIENVSCLDNAESFRQTQKNAHSEEWAFN